MTENDGEISNYFLLRVPLMLILFIREIGFSFILIVLLFSS